MNLNFQKNEDQQWVKDYTGSLFSSYQINYNRYENDDISWADINKGLEQNFYTQDQKSDSLILEPKNNNSHIEMEGDIDSEESIQIIALDPSNCSEWVQKILFEDKDLSHLLEKKIVHQFLLHLQNNWATISKRTEGITLPELNENSLKEIIELSSISTDGVNIGFSFHCLWDDEHGIGAVCNQDNKIEIGDSSTTYFEQD